LKYIIFSFCIFTFNAFAGGPSSFVCEENCSSSDPLTGIILMVLAVGVVYFGWLIWGWKSLKLIYIPVVIGCATVLFFGLPVRNYFLFPVGGLFVGWVLIGIVIFVFKYDYFGDTEASSANTFVVESSPIKAQQVTQSKPVRPNIENPESEIVNREANGKNREQNMRENPTAIYDVANWSNAMLEAALSNNTYKLPVYKNTLVKIELELANRRSFKDLKNK
jgi:hypothetical protein